MNTNKNIFFTTLGLFSLSVFTYAFWFIIAKINGPSTIGTSSTIVTLVIILTTVFSMDLYIGMKRLMAKYYIEQNIIKYSTIFLSVFLFLTFSSSIISIILIYPINILNIIGISSAYYWIIVIAVFLFSYQNLFVEFFISSMQSIRYFKYVFLGSLMRFPVFVIFFYIVHLNDLGTVISYYSLYLTVVILSSFYFIKNLKFKISITDIFPLIVSLIKISVSSWIPNVINVCGFWLGVIIIFSLNGSQEGGKFYITVGIFAVVLFIVMGISKVTHGMVQTIENDRRLNFLSNSIKMALIFTVPISTSILFFSGNYLGILGNDFISSHVNLSILMIGLPFVIISELVYYYLYGLGFHREVLVLGLIGNIPRVLIYFLITSLFGSTFAALGYLIGSLLQSFFSFKFIDLKINEFKIKEKTIITLIPFSIGFPLWLFDINYIYSTIIIIIGTFILYIRTGYFGESELSAIIYSVLPNKHADSFFSLFNRIIVFVKK